MTFEEWWANSYFESYGPSHRDIAYAAWEAAKKDTVKEDTMLCNNCPEEIEKSRYGYRHTATRIFACSGLGRFTSAEPRK